MTKNDEMISVPRTLLKTARDLIELGDGQGNTLFGESVTDTVVSIDALMPEPSAHCTTCGGDLSDPSVLYKCRLHFVKEITALKDRAERTEERIKYLDRRDAAEKIRSILEGNSRSDDNVSFLLADKLINDTKRVYALEDQVEAAEAALKAIADEGYVSKNSNAEYLRVLCDLQVDRARAALDGKPLPPDDALDGLCTLEKCPTCGVQFLPGFKNDTDDAEASDG